MIYFHITVSDFSGTYLVSDDIIAYTCDISALPHELCSYVYSCTWLKYNIQFSVTAVFQICIFTTCYIPLFCTIIITCATHFFTSPYTTIMAWTACIFSFIYTFTITVTTCFFVFIRVITTAWLTHFFTLIYITSLKTSKSSFSNSDRLHFLLFVCFYNVVTTFMVTYFH